MEPELDLAGLKLTEPQPGAWLSKAEFARVVCNTPLVSIDIVVRAPDRRVLLGRRTSEPARNVYFVPGGRITKNETRAAAFRRLTQTELGVVCDLSHARFLGVYDHLYPTNRLELEGFGTHYVVLGYEIDLPLEKAALPTEQHAEYVWWTDEQILGSPDVHENTKAYFRK
jgi:colanic acid biosynthesis protein WcaH